MKAALTGGIGSGKTLVCKIFEKLGAAVYEADIIAKNLYNTDAVLKKGITDLFGEGLYENGQLNRKMLAEIIFSDVEKLSQVNALVHPAVMRDFDSFVEQNAHAPYVMMESAIIFDTGLSVYFDKTITVSAPIELRLTRINARGETQEAAKKRMEMQLTDQEREQMADFVVQNNEQNLILPSIIQIHNLLQA